MLSTPRIRLILLAILPIVVSAMVMSVVVTTVTEKRMQAQNEQFSRTLTSYLAMTIAEHLVNNDALGINVLLSRMQEESALDYASVYDAQNQLIAQVGQHGAASNAFSREISFQDTTAGYIQVGFSSDAITAQSSLALSLVLVFHLILGFVICGFIWFAGDLATVWIFGRQSVDAQPEKASAELESEPLEPEIVEDPAAAILVFKIRPARLMDRHREQLKHGITLYGGTPIEHEGDDFLAYFLGENACFQSICTALLMLKVIEQIGPPVKLKVGMHWIAESDDKLAMDKATKHASYLASIDEQTALVSRTFEREIASLTEIEYESFHSSLTPDGEVFQILRVKNQGLIESQALQLIQL
ncbi:MAG: putative membrane protein affecting hemolysin expression [Dinoroseobacter sp.]|jgi:uncharacterized membrane protein affecting hemolysin expression